jgi:hypothetical protein
MISGREMVGVLNKGAIRVDSELIMMVDTLSRGLISCDWEKDLRTVPVTRADHGSPRKHCPINFAHR